jgi:AhpD family alkylhydroperoxidase
MVSTGDTAMQPRIENRRLYELLPTTAKSLRAISAAVKESGLEESLIHLVKMRASQINGCAFCLDMHSHDARRQGETEARLYLLNAWRESPLYSDRERAALAWTEALTLIADGHAPDAAFDEVSRHFSEAELAMLTSEIVAINAWNRIAIGYRFTHPVRAQAAGVAA